MSRSKKGSLKLVRTPDFFIARKGVVFFCLWLGFAAITLTFPNFSWLLPGIAKNLPFQQSLWASLFLFVGMIGVARLLPANEKEIDFSPWVARSLLLLCLSLGAYLRLYHLGMIPRWYGTDSSASIVRLREIVSIDNYQGFFGAGHSILPAWLAVAISLSHLLPDASSLVIQRLSDTIFDLGAICLFYFVGKEIAGRRMGVLTAVVGAFSKPLLTMLVNGWNYSVFNFGIAAVLLVTLRLMKKQDISHFLWWGAVVGFLGYTHFYFSPFVPFFIFLTWAWIFFKKPEKGKGGERPLALVSASFIILLVYFLYNLNAFSDNSWMLRIVDFGGVWLPCVAVAFVLVCAGFYFFGKPRNIKKNPWVGWVAGAWLATILSFPYITNEAIHTRMKMNTLAAGNGFISGPYLWAALHRVADSFQKLFWTGSDRPDMSLPGDAYFSYPEVILIALGLAFCLSKPNLKRSLILLAALVGLAVHFIANSSHSGRLVGCPPPFIILGALGLNELLKLFLNWNKNKIFTATAYLFLASFVVWSARGAFSRVYSQWAVMPKGIVAVHDRVIQDIQQGMPVYFAASEGEDDILYEGLQIHSWAGAHPNLVYVGSDEKGPNVVFYNRVSDFKPDIQTKLIKAFPEATVSEFHESSDPHAVSAYRVEIPFKSLSKPKQQLFKVIRVKYPYWRRTFSWGSMGFGLIGWDDKTAHANDPVAPEQSIQYAMVRYQGKINTKQGGNYEITCKAINRVKMLVDGQKIIDLFFPMTCTYFAPEKAVSKTIYLDPGDHQVEVFTCFERSYLAPDIFLHLKGTSGTGQLLWSSFDF